MEWLNDWKLWLFAASLIKDFVLVVGIILVKFNDLKHLDKDMTDVKLALGTITTKLETIEKNQSAMKAVCDERHSKK